MDDLAAANSWLVGLVAALAAAGATTWVVLLGRKLRGLPFLQFQSRRPVPWGAVGAGVAMLMVLMSLGSAFLGAEPAIDPLDSPLDMAEGIVQSALLVAVVTGLFVMIVISAGASIVDLGLPRYAHELVRDARIGAVAWLATLIPVYGLQALLVQVLQQPSQHPLIHMILENPHPVLLGASFFPSVIVAPISHELAFLLLLQGWLERLCANHRSALDADRGEIIAYDSASAAAGNVNSLQIAGMVDPQDTSTSPTAVHPVGNDNPSARAGGLPYGWVPILVSSALFALAHLGHGPDPFALFLLALLLGYVYQRTHRIVPCIVTHMLFNAASLGALLLVIAGAK